MHAEEMNSLLTAPAPAPALPRSADTPARQVVAPLFAQFVLSELTAIYANHDEGKLTLPGFLDALMRSYEGREAQLLKQV
jgi:hypothetical protein